MSVSQENFAWHRSRLFDYYQVAWRWRNINTLYVFIRFGLHGNKKKMKYMNNERRKYLKWFEQREFNIASHGWREIFLPSDHGGNHNRLKREKNILEVMIIYLGRNRSRSRIWRARSWDIWCDIQFKRHDTTSPYVFRNLCLTSQITAKGSCQRMHPPSFLPKSKLPRYSPKGFCPVCSLPPKDSEAESVVSLTAPPALLVVSPTVFPSPETASAHISKLVVD